ncbi:CsbD family protein [Acidisoma sp. S159]|uniref:CsbD family protein n=1 Tax=Acidisoma sp. S159 TaxID=1747225 RepID=UPI00131D4EB6|nr:CsbD family protein [Acidisoma sp. S159]
MSENKFSGTIDDINGKVQDAASGLTGDTGNQIRGKANQARGQAENILGDVAELIRDQPLTAALVIFGVAYLAGRLRLL